MRASAIVLAAIFATACMQPAFTGTDRMDTLASCQATESCGPRGDGNELIVPIVLGTALVGVVAIVMHRYVTADDD